MRKENVCSTAKRLLAAFMTAAMAASMTSPLAYAADETPQQAAQAAAPVVVDQPTEQTADAEPTFDTDLTYNSDYANTAPEGMQYTGTLEGTGMNVYQKEFSSNSANSGADNTAAAANAADAQKTAAQAAGVIPRTADDFPLAVVILLLVIGAGGFAVVVLLRKRSKHNR